MKAIAVLAALLASPSAAQIMCYDAAEVERTMRETYRANLAATGIAADGATLEFWIEPRTGAWVLIVLTPEGQRCTLVDGHDARTYPVGEAL